MSSIISIEEEELQKKIITLIKYDKRFQLWLKSHYSMYIKSSPPFLDSKKRDNSKDTSTFFYTREYQIIIKKKKLTILDKIKYYLSDLLLHLKS